MGPRRLKASGFQPFALSIYRSIQPGLESAVEFDGSNRQSIILPAGKSGR
jgi:hypothetical protein